MNRSIRCWWRTIAFFLSAFLSTASVRGQENPDPRLYVLIVTDTDSNLTDYVAGNRDVMSKLVKEAFATRPFNFELEVKDGTDVTVQSILRYYESLRTKVRPEDTLWFYYNGHGTMINGRHHLALQHDWQPANKNYGLSREKLLSVMKSLHTRLVVVTTDSCSNEFTRPLPQLPAVPKLPKASWPVINCLFFDHKGVVDLNGCQRDFFSWTYSDGARKGACFSWALAKYLCSTAESFDERFGVKDGIVSWERFLPSVASDTNKLYQDIRDAYVRMEVSGLNEESKRNRNLALAQKEQVPTLFSQPLAALAVQDRLRRNWLFGAVLNTTDFASGQTAATLGKVFDDTPAGRAGLRLNDEIDEIDGHKVRNGRAAYWAIDGSNGQIKLKYRRGDDHGELDIKLTPVKPKKDAK